MKIQCINCKKVFPDIQITLIPIEGLYGALRSEPHCDACFKKREDIYQKKMKQYENMPKWEKFLEGEPTK